MEAKERPSKKRKIDESLKDGYKDLKVVLNPRDESSQQAPKLLSNPKSCHATTGIPPTQTSPETARQVCTDGAVQTAGEERIADSAPDEPQLSKNQIKRLRRAEEWQANAGARKEKRKEKIRERKERRRDARKATGEAILGMSPVVSRNPRVDESASPQIRSKQLPITFVLDCGFDDLMVDKERISLASQLTRSYSDNHKALLRGHLVISSFGGHLKERFETVLSGHHENWKGVRFVNEDFMEAAEQAKGWMAGDAGKKLARGFHDVVREESAAAEGEAISGEVVYLSSESPYILTELKPYSTYIVGGLVDRNRHKGICYKRAMDRGVKTAKLPIGDYIQMTSRFVLATNHVIEIMLKWLELGDWGEAFLRVIPKRKRGILKGPKDQKTMQDSDTQNANEEEDQEDCGDLAVDHDGNVPPSDSMISCPYKA